MSGNGAGRAAVVSIEVDGRQKYIFETDKQREMLGASRIIDGTLGEAKRLLGDSDELVGKGLYEGVRVFQPVSGEIRAWIELDRRDRVLAFAWALRRWLEERGVEHTCGYHESDSRHLLEPRETDGEDVKERPSLARLHGEVGAVVSRAKAGKAGEDARPRCSLFAGCGIHGLDSANELSPKEKDERRRARGYRAVRKAEGWTRNAFYEEHVRKPVLARFEELGQPKAHLEKLDFRGLDEQMEEDDLDDRYVAFLCADGDALGGLLRVLDWNHPDWGDSIEPWARNRDFSRQLDRAVKAAFAHAMAEVVLPDPDRARKLASKVREGTRIDLPVQPNLLGGDDLWAMAWREVALPLALKFARRFQELVAEPGTMIARALEVAREATSEPLTLTMSIGIAFTKFGYPVHAMADAAESLLKSAKRRRKGHHWPFGQVDEGCIDWHWIESSRTESVKAARESGWMYLDRGGKEVLLLTTRPWTLDEAAKFEQAAKVLKALPSRKRAQLHTILRLGRPLSELAWESWWKGLRPDETAALERANGFLTSVSRALPQGQQGHYGLAPWRELGRHGTGEEEKVYFETPLWDLLSLLEVLHREGAEASGDDGGSDGPAVAEPVPAGGGGA